MIDIHVLTHSGTRPAWLKRCLRSLDGQPVVVHVVAGVEGSVGAGRAAGYQCGTAEFVGYVDSDDYVLPHCYRRILESLQNHHAVVPREYVEYEDGRRHRFTKRFHNGAVYRRRDIEPLIPAMLEAPHGVDVFTRGAIRPVQLDFVGYVWRVHAAGNHTQITPELLEQEKQRWLLTAPQ